MDILKNEVFSKEIQVGNLTIEYSVVEKDGCRVTFTARDVENRRLWRTDLTDADGNSINYSNSQDAIREANQKLRAITSQKESLIEFPKRKK